MKALLLLVFVFVTVLATARITHHKGHKNRIHKRPQQRRNVEILQVRTENGVVQGGISSTVDTQRPYYYFKGIPYALPPVENRRFLPPVKANNWTGVWNGTYERNICVQQDKTYLTTIGGEDCLYINVYTPQLPSGNSSLLPVMVWIYGGAFIYGDGNYDNYGPDFLLDENILIVTFNYRLGIFGFLSTEDETAPGNNGLRDQIMALQWVQSNIAAFGGAPGNVTIFGESAGAASVSYLLQTNLANGLYQRAIMQSGTTLCLWALARHARQYAFSVGRKLGIRTDNSKILVEALRNTSIDRLQSSSVLLMYETLAFDPLNGFISSPVKEPINDGAVFSSRSYGQLESGQYNKVPILLGFNSQESIGFAILINLLRPIILGYDLDPRRLVPKDMNITDYKRVQNVGAQIKNHYAGVSGAFSLTNGFLDYVSANEFLRPIRQYVRLVSKEVNTYLYKLSYEGKLGNPNRGNIKGVGHGEDVNYIFRTSNDTVNFEDSRTRRRMVRLWTNFAKTGNPTPSSDPLLQNVKWSPSNPDNLTYLDIGGNLKTKIDPDSRDTEFWDYIYKQYGNPPYDTY